MHTKPNDAKQSPRLSGYLRSYLLQKIRRNLQSYSCKFIVPKKLKVSKIIHRIRRNKDPNLYRF